MCGYTDCVSHLGAEQSCECSLFYSDINQRWVSNKCQICCSEQSEADKSVWSQQRTNITEIGCESIKKQLQQLVDYILSLLFDLKNPENVVRL